MTVIAHAGHWAVQIGYGVPLLLLAAAIARTKLRERRERRRDPG